MPKRANSAGAVLKDVRHGGDRLDVVDHGRAGVQARDRRERRLEPGLAAEPLERVEQRRFLAADVGPGAGVHDHVQVQVRAEDLLAEIAGRPRLGDGELEPPDHVHDLAAHVDEGLVGADRVAGDDHALDQRLRVIQQGRHVLARAGL